MIIKALEFFALIIIIILGIFIVALLIKEIINELRK